MILKGRRLNKEATVTTALQRDGSSDDTNTQKKVVAELHVSKCEIK